MNRRKIDGIEAWTIGLMSVFILSAAVLGAQVEFYGEAEIGLTMNLPPRGYESLVNPQNLGGITDLMSDLSLLAKMEAGDAISGLSLWISLQAYPLGSGLLAAATDASDPTSLSAFSAGEFVLAQGDQILVIDPLIFTINTYLGDYLNLTLGRQQLTEGYGFGWNPLNFFAGIKNPLDPNSELRGQDALSLGLYLDNGFSWLVFAQTPRNFLSIGLDYEDIQGGTLVTLSVGPMEVKALGFLDGDGVPGNDQYASGMAGGFFMDLLGLGVYGEGSFLFSSRGQVIQEDLALEQSEEGYFSALAGMEYLFETETLVTLEYFYNGEGMSLDQREDYAQALSSPANWTAAYFSLFRPGYLSQHYGLVNLIQPFYEWDLELSLGAMMAFDTASILVLPSLSWNIGGALSLEMDYLGSFSWDQEAFSEATESPVEQSLRLGMSYYF